MSEPKKLPSGKWRVRWHEPDGSRPGQTFTTKAEARNFLAQKLYLATTREYPSSALAAIRPPPWPEWLERPFPADVGELVYFIGERVNARIKIGRTRSLSNRFSDLRHASSGDLILLATIAADRNSRETEAGLHRRFDYHRLHGEWFRADPELVLYIAGLRVPVPVQP